MMAEVACSALESIIDESLSLLFSLKLSADLVRTPQLVWSLAFLVTRAIIRPWKDKAHA